MNDNEILAEVNRTITMEADELRALTSELDGGTVVAVAKALMNCKGKVILSGCGTSAMAAKKVAHSLSCIEIPALFLSPSDAVHGALGVLQEEDVLILISKGGNTSELTNLIPACKNIGTTHLTNGCYRLHPVEWNIGEAAGLLVAQALAVREPPRWIRSNAKALGAFQDALRRHGVELDWPKLRPL